MGGRARGRIGRRRAATALGLVAVLSLVGSACSSGGSKTTAYKVFVEKFRFNGMPASIKAGQEFNVEFTNREELPITHEMVLIAVPSGKTAQNVIDDAKATGTDSEDEWLHFGEIGEVDTGETKVGTFSLPPGTYALACWQTGNLEGGDGDAHAARGMVFAFTVTS